jgi:hypothetical protein
MTPEEESTWLDLERVFPGTANAELPVYRYPSLDILGRRVGPLVPKDDPMARLMRHGVPR